MSAIGSGIDVNSIVRQLVAAERAPSDARFDRTSRQLQAQVSAIGSLRSAMTNLRTAATALGADTATKSRIVKLGDDPGFSATATAGAALGQYQIEVIALAKSHKLASAGFAATDTPVGTGTLTIASGETTLDVQIGAESNTLAGIRDAINAQAAGNGVLATLIQSDAGSHLVLSATEPGVANALTVSTSGGDGGLAAFTFDGAGGGAMSETSQAVDAQVKIDGLARSVSGNRIADLVPGVTVTLTRATPGVTKELAVSSDPAAQRNAVKAFVAAYNAANGAIASTTAYNTTTRVAAALNGDALVRGASQDLRTQLSEHIVDLKELGITVGKDGSLTLSDAKFDETMAKDPSIGARVFHKDTGLGASVKASMDRMLDADGLLTGRSEGLTARTKKLADQRAQLDRRMDQVQARYRAQFVALDSMVTKLQGTSNFLAQQLANLPKYS